jgi:site-specific recombinase XerD
MSLKKEPLLTFSRFNLRRIERSIRKTFLTSLASQGVSVFVLASLAEYKSITTTQRYITTNDDVKRKVVELF